jgi:hypothetical protein
MFGSYKIEVFTGLMLVVRSYQSHGNAAVLPYGTASFITNLKLGTGHL